MTRTGILGCGGLKSQLQSLKTSNNVSLVSTATMSCLDTMYVNCVTTYMCNVCMLT